ncbi:MAG: hypothetical protein AAF698_12700, partial [Pseudomonadota bacterium]
HITTEIRPIFAYHDVPGDFISGGGRIIVGAVQLRAAITERLGIIATLDGYTDIGFDDVLSDDAGFNDLAFGVKYAVLYEPDGDEGLIGTVGLRYTAPVGNLDTSIIGLENTNIDLNGTGAGYINPFFTGRLDTGDWGIQTSLGAQLALDRSANWSFIHWSGHVDYEVFDGIFPFVETNAFIPVDGGSESIVNDVGLVNLTGADIADIGASDPQAIFTVGGGMRFRLTDSIIFGAGVDGNVINREDGIYGWRVVGDAVVHF